MVAGRRERRGLQRGQLVMARFNDTGPYSVENVYCTSVEQNTKDTSKEKLSAANKASWAIGRAKNSPLFKKGAGNPNSRPVETPAGTFASATLAAEHFGFTRNYASYLARTERHGWRRAEASACNLPMETKADQFIWGTAPQVLSQEDRESMLIEMELRRERNRRRSETMRARAAAKLMERLSAPPMALDEPDAALGGRITQQVNDQARQELQQEPRRRVKKGRVFEGMTRMAVSTPTSEEND
jgi:hypothetical protein